MAGVRFANPPLCIPPSTRNSKGSHLQCRLYMRVHWKDVLRNGHILTCEFCCIELCATQMWYFLSENRHLIWLQNSGWTHIFSIQHYKLQHFPCIFEFLKHDKSKNLWDFIVACIDNIINHTLKPTQFREHKKCGILSDSNQAVGIFLLLSQCTVMCFE